MSNVRPAHAPLFQHLEARRLMSAALVSAAASAVRSIDGSGNNLSHTAWGTPGSALVRDASAQYGDGYSTPAGANRPGARQISNQFLGQHLAEDIFNKEGMSAYAYAWGQFVDHDMSLTNDASTPAASLNIPVPQGDFYFDPEFTGTQVIGFNRSQVVAGTGTGAGNPAQNPNSVTAFIDASNVYGSDAVRAAALRTMVGGKLKTSDGGQQMPYNTANLDNQTAGGPADMYFLGGDVRANENSELTSIQVLFVREHNRLATQIGKLHKNWTDEQIYQEARSIVIGEIEHITYDEFLPSILSTALPKYTGYKPNVNPQVAQEFSTAAMRFGHSIVGDDVQFFDDDAQTTLPDLKVAETFFAPGQQLNGGTDGLLKYLAAVSSQEMDSVMVNGIRNFLFGAPGQGGFDLAALDVQRGRDHGLADLNTTRASLGLAKYTSFSQMTSNPSLAASLQAAYGNVDNVDLFVGGLVENKPDGQILGPTFDKIMVDQFTRSRDGDRFWYQKSLSAPDLAYVQSMSLAKLIKLDTSITNVQTNVFHFDVKVSGRVWNDANRNGIFDAGEQPIANAHVTLADPAGGDDGSPEIIDYATTDAQGRYSINKIQVGDYTVSVFVPGVNEATTPDQNLYAFHVNSDLQFTHDFGFHSLIAQGPISPGGTSLGSPIGEDAPTQTSFMSSSLTARASSTSLAGDLIDALSKTKLSDSLNTSTRLSAII